MRKDEHSLLLELVLLAPAGKDCSFVETAKTKNGPEKNGPEETRLALHREGTPKALGDSVTSVGAVKRV